MRTGAGLALICVGAILAFAVTANTSVLNLHTAGWVLIAIGIIGMCLPPQTYGWLGRRLLVRRTRYRSGAAQAGQTPVPSYVVRNPGTLRLRAGLPPSPTLPDGTDSETEVTEDIYEE